MATILIPDLDEEEDTFPIPQFAKPSFGANVSSSSLPEAGQGTPDGSSHRQNPSVDNLPRPSYSTPARPTLKGSASYSVGIPTPPSTYQSQHSYAPSGDDHHRLGKLSNGSNTSLVTAGTSIGSTPGFLQSRKGSKTSLTSIRNAFKAAASPVPPVPNINPTAYPALRNPFSRFDSPASPVASGFNSPRHTALRKQSTASARSMGGRSTTSQSSSTFRADDHPVPALPPIPTRSTPSRMGRQGSDAASIFAFTRRNGSVSGLDGIGEGSTRTAGEEAMRVIWKDFVEAADGKIARICSRPLNTQPSLPAYLDSGIDATFDTLINSLANCARRHARRIADLLNGWCKSHCEGIGASEVRAHLDRSLGLNMRVEDAAAILGSRKTSTARFILNRALIELVKITPRENLGEELGMTLEQNAFNAYRSEKLEESSQVPHRKAVSQLQVELLGLLSTNRFLTVSDRFTRELSRYTASQSSKETEARIEHLLRAMRHLKIRVYPEAELEMSAEFIQQLATYFANAHGQILKYAYAETLTSLLHPVIETATAEVNHPLWSKAVALILSRALAMAAKPRYWSVAFPLLVVCLGVSPREVFMQHWQTCVDGITSRYKDRSLRPIAMNCFVRLLWIYLNRCPESSTSMRKRLDPLLRSHFSFPGGLYPPELQIEPFVAILHYVMTHQLEFGEDFVGDYLRDYADSNAIHTDRATALVRAIGYTLRALEMEKPAMWPQTSEFNQFNLEGFESSGEVLDEGTASKPEIVDFLKKCNPAIANRLFACDRMISHLLLSNDGVSLSNHASSSSLDGSETTTRKHGDVQISYPARFDPTLRLHAAVLDILPRAIAPDTAFPPIANILCRGTFSADPNVCVAASDAMRRFAQNPDYSLSLTNTYLQFIFETRHVFRDTFVGSRLLDSQFERVIRLWLDILQTLVTHQRLAAVEGEESQQIVTGNMIEKIEGCALFLLCSSNVSLRKLASQILVAARDLEGQQRRPSAAFRYSRITPDKPAITRIFQLYEATPDESDVATMRALPWCTSSDRHRLDLATAKDRTKLLQRIAESDHAKDGLLWLALLPHLVGRICTILPGPAQDLRNTVVATVLRLQGHVANIASVSASRATPGLRSTPTHVRTSSDTAILADHWRSYLSVLCVTMPTQQSAPSTPPVQRTKEAVILTPDTIGSPALFHYLTSLLSWEDPRFKDAAVYAMGSIGQTLLRPLSETLLSVVRRLADGAKPTARETTRRSTVNGPLWTSLAHVFRLISPLILDSRISSHLTNLSSMIGFSKLTHTFLSDRTVKEDFDLQSLRRSFCIVVENLTNALGKLDSSDRFLGEEMRGAIFKLCYEWCHVGRRPDVAKARESHTLQAAAEGYRGERDRAQYLDDLQAKTKLLSAAAAEAMAGLCQGKLISSTETTPAVQSSDHIVEPLTVLRWIRGMFSSQSASHHETGRKALFALLKYNWQCSRLLDEVLHQSFGEGEQFSLDSSFFGVVAEVLSEGLVELPIQQYACLALSKLGHPVPDIRLRAFQLTQSLESPSTSDKPIIELLPSIGSSAANVYRAAQKEMASRLANSYADHALDFLSECTTRLSQLEAPRRQATLAILPAWLGLLDLAPDASELSAEDAALEHQSLSNLMYLAIRFSDDHLEEIREIFISFAGDAHGGNTTALVKFLFEQGGRRQSADFVTHALRVMACLAQSESGDVIFDEILTFVEPSSMASLPESDIPPSPHGSLANLDTLMSAPSARSQTFSTGQLALLFAGELLPYRLGNVELSKRLPTLLHVALVHSDHAGSALREQCQTVLFQVLRAWICDTSQVAGNEAMAMWQTAEIKVATLSRGRDTEFWKAEDAGGPESAFLAPSKMTSLIVKILGVLLPLQPRVRQVWSELALTWATSCPIRHLACRSFQVFRILSPRISPRMISDILARLSSTIGSSSPEIQTFNLEVIRTFAAITQNLSASEINAYPQIFWCSVACLTTPFEEEFTEVIEMLSHILDKTNLSDPAVISQLMAFRPPDWVGPPPHLQTLLLPGLRSSKSDLMTFDLIRRLASCAQNDLIDPPSERLLHGFIAALPWMLHSADLGEPNEDLGMMALDLASIADTEGNASFARLLTSFAHNRFRAKDDFIRQAASLLRDFMVDHSLEILSVLLGFVLNTNDWMREKSMLILKLILASPEARAQVTTHGNELLQPLLRLVSTKHSSQALDVLDLPVSSDAPITGEIFGPISSTGWSVPNVKEASALTRENVTAVFNTCAVETRAASAHFSVVQFADMKGFNINNPSQQSLDLPSPPSSGFNTRGGNSSIGMDNASMGDLVGALHSLNQFFDDGLDDPGSPKKGSGGSSANGHGRLPSETLSERRIRAIMARGRNPSISSPIYENNPYPSQPNRHRHTASEMTTSSTSSMNDNDLPSSRRYPPGFTPANGSNGNVNVHNNANIAANRHATHASFSSTGSGYGYIEEKTENLFGLEEDADMSGLGAGMGMGVGSGGNTSSVSIAQSFSSQGENGTMSESQSATSQSTPVMMRRLPTPQSGRERGGY